MRERDFLAIGRPGGDRLSRVLRQSIIGAGAFHGRVRNGIGCSRSARTTRSANSKNKKLGLFFQAGRGLRRPDRLCRETGLHE